MASEKTIRILPDQVINQIAAGEVIERPAAAVKELLENSLDSGATQVEVEFSGGGKNYIRIEDNGCGMTPDQALLALQRHATSKLRHADDLLRLTTLGFRGEALPSVASISRFTLRTRTRDSEHGTELLVDAGKVVHSRQCALAFGTRIEVAQLFAPVPARRKFLKSDATEGAHITQLVRLHALGRPDVGFHLIENRRTAFRSAPCPTMRDRVAEIWGAPLARGLIELPAVEQKQPHALRLRGLVGRAGEGRTTRRDMIWLVNGRPIENRTLTSALIEAYEGFLPKGRYPLSFLFLEIDPAAVDVNIHPSKREVRFGSEGAVRHFVYTAVRDLLVSQLDAVRGERTVAGSGLHRTTPQHGQTFSGADVGDVAEAVEAAEPALAPPFPRPSLRPPLATPRLAGTAKQGIVANAGQSATETAKASSASAASAAAGSTANASAAPAAKTASAFFGLPAVPRPVIRPAASPIVKPALPSVASASASAESLPVDRLPAAAADKTPAPASESAAEPTQPLSDDSSDVVSDDFAAEQITGTEAEAVLAAEDVAAAQEDEGIAWQFLGRLHREYALLQAPAGLVVMRLRAAHERVWFERIRNYFSQENRTSQQLLLPLSVEFDPLAAAALSEHLEFFNAHGFEVEAFGRNFFRIHAHPGWLAVERVESFVRECVEFARRGELKGRGQRAALEGIAKLAATRAVRLGDRMRPEEIEALAAALLRCQEPLTCPNGKPTLIEWSMGELGRRFGVK